MLFALAEHMNSTSVLQMDQNKAIYLKNKMCMQIPPEYIDTVKKKKKSLKKKKKHTSFCTSKKPHKQKGNLKTGENI